MCVLCFPGLPTTFNQIFVRLLQTEHIAPFLRDILKIMMTTLETDSEDNALLCLRALFELHKAFRVTHTELLEEEAKPFVAFALKIYTNFEATANFLFDETRVTAAAAQMSAKERDAAANRESGASDMDVDAKAGVATKSGKSSGKDADSGSDAAKASESEPGHDGAMGATKVGSREQFSETPLVPSTSSFIVLKECPSTITFLFQLYQKLIKENVPKLLGPMVSAIGLPGPQPVPPALSTVHVNMKDAQVKALCFLTYLLKSFSNDLRPYHQSITNAIVSLIKTCPYNGSIRKELLNAARHFISDSHELVAEFRSGLYKHIDVLMKEDIIVGKAGLVYDSLRPLAYNLLAELVHHVRNELNISQIGSVIYIYSRNLHDSTLPISMQTTSARLMLNLVLCMRNYPSKVVVRDLLLRIIEAYVSKLSTLRHRLKRIASSLKINKSPSDQRNRSKTSGQTAPGAASGRASGATVTKSSSGAASADASQKDGTTPPTTQLPSSAATPASSARASGAHASKGGGGTGTDPEGGTKTTSKDARTPSASGGGASGGAGASQRGTEDASKSRVSAPATEDAVAVAAASANPSRQEITIDGLSDPAKDYSDYRYLIRSLFTGLKAIVAELVSTVAAINANQARQPVPGGPLPPVMQGQALAGNIKDVLLSPTELQSILGILPYGVSCLLHFTDQDCSELLELLAETLVSIPVRNMCDVFSYKISSLYDALSTKPVLIALPVHLIHNRVTLPTFGDVLVKFLMKSHLQDLRDHSATDATIVLRLFHVLFTAVSKIPENEVILRMHIAPLVQYCLTALGELDKAAGYVQLLRSLFRSLAIQKRDAARKTDVLYREFGRVLQPCIATLLSLLNGPEAHAFRPHIVELLLTLPADLSSLLPDLSRLMPALVLSLNAAQPELVQHGLRTLEVWVDSLNPEFLEPAMAPVEAELLRSLWSHLKPYPPYVLGIKALQLLGKLGGRCRRFFHEALELDCKNNPEHGLRLMLTFEPTTSFLVPLDRCINLARTRVYTSSGGELYYRRQAVSFLQVCLSSVINFRGTFEIPPAQDAAQGAGAQTASSVTAEKIKTALLNPQHVVKTQSVNSTRETYGSKTKTQLMAERALFKSLVITVIAAAADDELQSLDPEWDERHTNTREFIVSVCRHFALLYAMQTKNKATKEKNAADGTSSTPSRPPGTFSGQAPQSTAAAQNALKSATHEAALKELDSSLFLDAVVMESLSSTSVSITAIALQGLKILLDTLMLISALRKNAGVNVHDSMSAFVDELLPRLLHCSLNHAWSSMRGGVAGLRLTVKTIPAEYLQKWQSKIMRAYLGVIRYHPSRANSDSDVVSGIRELLKTTLPQSNGVEPEELHPETLSLLITELFASGSKPLVRTQVESCLKLLSEHQGKTMSELLGLTHERFVDTLLQKSLRMKTLESQIETISALSYCIKLEPSRVTLSPEVLTLINEALGLATQERELSKRLVNPRNSANLSRLYLACVEFLNAVVSWETFRGQGQRELRDRIICVFFRSMTSSTTEIVDISKEGLRTVIDQRNLPKELLHASIRPILINLANHTHFTSDLLVSLGRLLELLSGWFNVTLGGKMIEHLKKWLDPEKLRRDTKSWGPGEDLNVAAAIMDIFHLLPPAASNLVEQLVQLTCQLEAVLPKYSGCVLRSPFRLPLLKYLARFPDLSVKYFLANMDNSTLFNMFLALLRLPESEPMRKELAKSSKVLIDVLKNIPPATLDAAPGSVPAGAAGAAAAGAVTTDRSSQLGAYIRMIKLVRVVAKASPGWLSEQPEMYECLKKCWLAPARAERLANERQLSIFEAKESKWIAKSIIVYLDSHHDEYPFFIELLGIFNVQTEIDFSFLKDYLSTRLSAHWPLEERKKILKDFLVLYRTREEKNVPETILVTTLQCLILPMIAESFQEGDGSQLVDTDIVNTIITKLLDPGEDIMTLNISEGLRIVLLQLATLLIRFMPQHLMEYRRQLIKFGWNHLKREEGTSKLWAFVNVCHFLEKYQAPDKIILQVFVALLRTSQADSKVLVRQALDIITPALPTRLGQDESEKFPTWIRYTKKMLVEDGHSMANLLHIFHLIVRHSDLFYAARSQFLPYIINSLSKLGLPNAPLENRKLAIDLAGLVIKWEQRYMSEVAGTAPLADAAKAGQKRPRDAPAANALIAGGVKSAKMSESDSAKQHATARPAGGDGTAKPPLGPSAGGGVAGAAPSKSSESDNLQMRSMVLNFLVKMVFLSATETKDREVHALNKQTFVHVSSAMKLWPNVFIKLDYLGRLLFPGNSGAGQRPGEQDARQSPMLWTAMALILRAIDLQGSFFLKTNMTQIMALLEPGLHSNSEQVLMTLSKILAKAFEVAPKELVDRTPESELVKRIQNLVKSIMENYIAGQTLISFGAPIPASHEQKAPPKQLKISRAMSFAMDTLRGIRDMSRYADFYEKISPTIIKCLQKLSREHEAALKSGAQQRDGSGMEYMQRSDQMNKLEFGSVVYNLSSALSLVTGRSMQVQDQRKIVMSSISLVLQDPRASASRVLIPIIQLVLRWISVKISNQKEVKELVGLMIALVRVFMKSPASAGSDYERAMHRVLLTLCSPSMGGNVVSDSLRKDIFEKVEKYFLIGLRARNPSTRRAFFKLHNEDVEQSLFKRLEFIVTGQDWECLSDTFWLKQALDFLLAILVENDTVCLAPNSALISPLSIGLSPSAKLTKPSDPSKETAGDTSAAATAPATDQPQPQQQQQQHRGKAPTLDSILEHHAVFLRKESSLKVSSLTRPLRELAHADSLVAYSVWVLVFPIVWATLDKEQQVHLAKPLISLLSKEYHQRQQSHRPNVVQALLEGISLSQPQPKIPSEVIRYLGKTYNAWHIAIPLLESHVMLFPQDNRCFDALTHIYRLLNENDMHAGLWRRRCSVLETRVALSLSQHGLWSEAQDVLFRVIEKNSKTPKPIPKSELCLWEEMWIDSCRQLGQWNVLAEFSKAVDHPDVLMDTLWRVSDWQNLKDVVLPRAQVDEGPKQAVVRAYSLLHEGNLPDADRCIQHGIQSAMQRWWQMPEYSLREREPLLKNFQLLVEAQESARILIEIRSSQKAQGAPGLSFSSLKEILETWRLRTPNSWDSMGDWMDVSLWRSEIYNFVIQAFKSFEHINPQLHQMGYHGKAWTVNKLAHIARRLKIYDVGLEILNKMYGYNTMELQEAVVKICEQAKIYLSMEKGSDKLNGLNVINALNLEFFPKEHKAEIFRLKGELLWSLGDVDGANSAMSTALSLHQHLPEGWLSWGALCDECYAKTSKPHWLEYAVTCYMQASLHSGKASRTGMTKVMNALAFSGHKEIATTVLRTYVDKLPSWLWLTWIPQLLQSLQRVEGSITKDILTRIAKAYPQSVYYLLRRYLLERRQDIMQQEQHQQKLGQQQKQETQSKSKATDGGGDEAMTNTAAASGGGGGPSAPGASDPDPPLSTKLAFDYAKEIMEKLRTQHTHLAAEMEVFLTELGSRFLPSPEERLLAVIYALIQRCYKFPALTTDKVPQPLQEELQGVCRACFSQDTVAKHKSFVDEYKENFVADLQPYTSSDVNGETVANEKFPRTLQELINRLKEWRELLQNNVEDNLPSTLRLEDESIALLEMVFLDVEIPGQYMGEFSEPPQPERLVKLEGVGGDIDIVRRQGTSYRRLQLVGNDGKRRSFLVQTSISASAHSDERILQLMGVINRLMDEHGDAKLRHLTFHCPVIVPVWPQVRIAFEDASTTTYYEAYDINCARHGKDPDDPIMLFKGKLNAALQKTPDYVFKLRQDAYKYIADNMVTDSVFNQYMYKTLPTCNQLWAFKRYFASQLALSSLLCYILKVGGRSPAKLLFAKSTGQIIQSEFHPIFHPETGIIENQEPVPFRLTRNLNTFLTPFGVEGMFVASMAAASRALVQPKTCLDVHLALYFRDELAALQSRSRGSNGSQQQSSGTQGGGSFVSMSDDDTMKRQAQANVQETFKMIRTLTGSGAPGTNPGQGHRDRAATFTPANDAGRDIHQPIIELVERALSTDNLCKMDPMWHPWL